MKHLSQDDLVLHYYGECRAKITQHIATCPECREKVGQLSSMLSGITLPEPPPRGDDYAAKVWTRIRPKLTERMTARPWWAVPRRWMAVATVAIVIAIAFMAGRYTNRPPATLRAEATNSAHLPQKVLVVALGDYLDSSEMLLVEVAHANRPEDLNTQRRYASELVASNRLYRQTAQRVGDANTGALLDQLERMLLQVEHTPPGATASDIQDLQQQIESGGLLFKVRVAQLQMKSKSKSINRGRTAQASSTFLERKQII
jgi:hypothetical protein